MKINNRASSSIFCAAVLLSVVGTGFDGAATVSALSPSGVPTARTRSTRATTERIRNSRSIHRKTNRNYKYKHKQKRSSDFALFMHSESRTTSGSHQGPNAGAQHDNRKHPPSNVPGVSPRTTTSTARSAALVDMEGASPSGSRRESGGIRIRSRVQTFLKKRKRGNKFVQEVTDIDAVKGLIVESGRTAAYTAVIFHAPYCKACKASMPLFENLAKKYTSPNGPPPKQRRRKQQHPANQCPSRQRPSDPVWAAASSSSGRGELFGEGSPALSGAPAPEGPLPPDVRFVSVPVTQENAAALEDGFGVTRFPLAHIYDPKEGLVDERPVLRKRFAGFEERLASVVGDRSGSHRPSPEGSFNATSPA
ncbi:unnamed protein product [Pseudo-nitzschia multistriata]|uniref:Thioredoxin domain-containing protein n=1 Tax=Pseudo-nitzschia multistriata TaxID=183589 RepID=A0A448ZTK2_9STRA|nr:unnamed protein product [Pseudo-nitzschia multistriata]